MSIWWDGPWDWPFGGGAGSTVTPSTEALRVSQFGIETLGQGTGRLRVSQYGIEALTAAIAPLRVSQFGREVAHSPTWAAAPTLTISNIQSESAQLDLSAFNHPQGLAHTRTNYIVATSSGFSTGTQVVNATVTTSSYPDTSLLSYTASSLGSSTPYFAMARQGSSANWGYFSAVSTFKTADQIAPAAPTISSTDINQDTVVLVGSAYVSSGSSVHFASQWRIATSSSMGSTTLVYNGSTDFYNLTQITLSVLQTGSSYWADVRYRGAPATDYSARSTPHNFVTTSSTVGQPTTPTLTATAGVTTIALAGSAFTASSGAQTHIQSHWRATGTSDRVIDGTGWELFSTSLLLASTAVGPFPDSSTGLADVRYQQSNGQWSEWGTDNYTLGGSTDYSPNTGFRLELSNPGVGEPMAQSTAITWSPVVAGYQTALSYSSDNGLTWTTITTGTTAASHTFDFSTLPDGTDYILRAQPLNSTAGLFGEFSYQHFVANGSSSITNTYVDLNQQIAEEPYTTASTAWTEIWNVAGYDFRSFNMDGGIYGITGSGSSQGPSKVLRRDAFGEALDVDISTRHLIGNGEGGFPWEAYWTAEQLKVGNVAQLTGQVGTQSGFELNFFVWPIGAFGNCDVRGVGDAFLELTYWNNGAASIISQPIGIAHVLVRSCPEGGSKVQFYTSRLQVVTKTVNGDGTRDYIVKAMALGRGITHSSGDLWHIESTFASVPENCGGAGYAHNQSRFGGNGAFGFNASLSASRVESGFDQICIEGSSASNLGEWEGKQIYVEDADGTFQPLTNLGGQNWVVDASWEYSLNAPTGAARVGAFREVCSTASTSSKSLAPLITDSVYNVTSTGGYAELILPGRDILIYHACVPCAEVSGGSLSTSSTSWVLSFDGTIDDVNWGAPGYDSRVQIEARSQDSNLLDRWVETPKTYSTDVELEDLLQNILTDHFSTDYSITLYSENGTTATPFSTADSPGWLVNAPIEITRGALLEQMRNLAFQIGWDLRYRRVSPTSSLRHRLTLYEPARGSTETYDTWDASEYIEVPDMAIARSDVRNVVDVAYTSTSGAVSIVQAIDPVSVARYRRRYMLLDETEGSNINTSSEANRLAVAALKDLAEPIATKTINTMCYPAVDFNQHHLFESNSVHYNQDKVLAIAGWRHENKVNRVRTHIDLIDDSKLSGREYIIREETVTTGGTGTTDVTTSPYIQGVSLSRTDDGDCAVSGFVQFRVGWTISTALTTSDAYTVWLYRRRNEAAWTQVATFIDDAGTTGAYTDTVNNVAHIPGACTPDDTTECNVSYRYQVRLLEVTGFLGNQFISTQNTALEFINERTCQE